MIFLRELYLNLDFILIVIVFLFVLINFLRDFKVTSGRSWLVLAGLTAFGGLITFQWWRKRQLLKQFEAREEQLAAVERKYKEALDQKQISKEAYEKAQKELEASKVDYAVSIAQSDERLKNRIEEIRKTHEGDVSFEQTMRNIDEFLKR